MKKFLYYLLLVSCLMLIVVFYRALHAKMTTKDSSIFSIPRSGYTYRIGHHTLYQIEPKTIDAPERIIHAWKVPFINKMDPYDVFLIVEQQRYRQESYPYTEIIRSKNISFFKKEVTSVEKEGQMEWDATLEEPLITTDGIAPEQHKIRLRAGHIFLTFCIPLLVILLLLTLRLGFKSYAKSIEED